MAVLALATGCARDDRDTALTRAALRLRARVHAGEQSRHGETWSAWCGALLAREQGVAALVSADGTTVVFDGWLRNARELAAGAGLAPDAGAAEIVRVLWRWSGAECLSALRGGYALLVIDERAAQVHLARDPTGMRPLFYRRSGERLWAASSELAVLDAAQLGYTPEPVAMAAFAALRAPPPGVAYLQGVDEVPAGCVLRIAAQGVQRRIIDLRLGQRLLRLPTLDAYAQAWRSVLADATRDALARGSMPGISLSGGIDSAALAAMAAAPGISAAPLAVSWRLPGLAAADESEWINATATACRMRQIGINGERAWPLSGVADWPLHPDTPLANPYRLLKQAQWRAAKQAGIDVLLSGDFGDHVYPGARAWLLGALVQRRPLTALRELRLRLRSGMPWREPGVRAALRLAVRGNPLDAPPGWLGPAARIALGANPAWPESAASSVDPARSMCLLGLDAAGHAAQDTGFSDAAGLLIAHPYRDERVIDLALSIPIDVWSSGGTPKALTRYMLRGLLPDAVRLRPKAGSLTPLFRLGMRSAEAARVRSLLFAADAQWPQWLDADSVHGAIDSAAPTDAHDVLLWLATSVELWLRGLSRGAPVLGSMP